MGGESQDFGILPVMGAGSLVFFQSNPCGELQTRIDYKSNGQLMPSYPCFGDGIIAMASNRTTMASNL